MDKKDYGGLNTTLIHQLRKKVEELKDEKRFSEDILSAMPEGLDIIDKKGNILYLNKAFLNIFGKKAIGQKCWKIYKDDKKQCQKCPLKIPISIGKTETIESENIAGGKTFLITHTCMKLQDGSDAILEVFKDITEMKKHKESLELFKDLINQSNDGIFVIDPKTARFLEVNEKAFKSLGYKKSDMLKMNIMDIEASLSTKFSWKKHVAFVKKKSTLLIEGSHKRKNGSVFPVEVNVKYITIGKKEFMLAFVRDLTERKKIMSDLEESKKHFELLYLTSNDAIMTLEPPTWRFTAGNPATVKMFGTKTEKKFTSIAPWQLSPKYQLDGKLSSVKAKKMIGLAVKKGKNYFNWTHKRLNGEIFPATVLLSKVVIGKKMFLQATVRDFSKNKERFK